MRLDTGELIIKKGGATHQRSGEGVGGKLFLTNLRLLFRPHFLNIQTQEISIPLVDILVVDTPHSDFISSKLAIVLKDRSIEFFIVRKRRDWMKEITNVIGAGLQASHANNDLRQAIADESRRSLRNILIGAIVTLACSIVVMLLFLKW